MKTDKEVQKIVIVNEETYRSSVVSNIGSLKNYLLAIALFSFSNAVYTCAVSKGIDELVGRVSSVASAIRNVDCPNMPSINTRDISQSIRQGFDHLSGVMIMEQLTFQTNENDRLVIDDITYVLQQNEQGNPVLVPYNP